MNVEAAIQALVDAEVEFVIIGGWSAILNGSAYITNDLDICFARNSDNLRRLMQALAPYHPRLRDLPLSLPFVWAALRNSGAGHRFLWPAEFDRSPQTTSNDRLRHAGRPGRSGFR